jgi:pyochelin biosynthetic protein PchG
MVKRGKYMRRLKTIVCGTVFGRYYIEGIMRLPERFELVGIVSRGSKQSIEMAKKYSVPLITDIGQIKKENVDVACVVVKSTIIGGKGTDLAINFLRKGIHVIQEQPVHYEDYKICLQESKEADCKYELNTFYPNLFAVKKFIETSYIIQKVLPVTYIRAESSVQVLFPMLDILSDVLNGLNPSKFEVLKGNIKQRFAILNGEIKGVPVTLTIDNQMDLSAPESNLTMFHRITLGTQSGTLMLTDTHGKVLWTPVLHESLKSARPGEKNFYAELAAQEEVLDVGVGNLGDIFFNKWPMCMATAFSKFYNDIENKRYITIKNQQMLTLCQLWNKIGNMLGPYETVDIVMKKPAGLKEIFEKEKIDK